MFKDFNIRQLFEGKHIAYERCVEHAEDMAVHVMGMKPMKLLDRVRPREDPEVKAYRLLSYEPITTATADKAVFMLQKIMNPKLWSIKFPDSGKDLEQYLFKDYPFYKSIINYTTDVIIRSMVADPNGVMVVMPINMDIPDTVKVEPIVSIFNTSRLWAFEFSKYYVLHHKTDKENFEYLYYIDGQEIVYFKVRKEPNDTIVTSVLSVYNHGIGEPPVWFLGGILNDIGTTGILYRSYFSAALPHWNKAVTADSDLDGAFVNHMHPIRVEVTEECDFNFEGYRCMGGMLNREGGQISCPSCGGTGRKSVKSPYGVYQVSKPGLGEQVSGLAPVSYVTIPTEPTRMLEARVQTQLDKGLAALNMFFTVGENQSGIAKVLDRTELYDFLLTISSRVFDTHLANTIKYSAAYIYLNKGQSKLPTIAKPVTFDLLSVQEEAAILKDAQDAGLSSNYIRIKMANMIQKDLFGVSIQQQMAMDSLTLNTLAGFDVNQIIDGVNAGLVTEVDANIYFNIDKYIQQVYAEDPEFGKKPYQEKRAIVEEMATVEEMEIPDTPEGV
jgi:hypothetical protein